MTFPRCKRLDADPYDSCFCKGVKCLPYSGDCQVSPTKPYETVSPSTRASRTLDYLCVPGSSELAIFGRTTVRDRTKHHLPAVSLGDYV